MSATEKTRTWAYGSLRASLRFAGVLEAHPGAARKRRPCECCSRLTPRRTPVWLTSRWVCARCAERYLLIEERARVCGVKRLQYVAPVREVARG